MKILITGATGLIGKYLVKSLISRGDEVFVLTRDSRSAAEILPGIKNFAEWKNPDSLEDIKFNAIINLAGMNLDAKRWNEKVKQQLYDSRINSTRKVVELIRTMNNKPEVFINASGVDYYGDTGDKNIYEDSLSADSFISKLVYDWETEALEAEKSGVRVVLLRTGFVVAKDSKAFKKMVLPFKLFAGGYAGRGKQYLSWIHIDDLVNVYEFILDNPEIRGAVNSSSPNPERMKNFAKYIGKALHRPWFFPAPGFLLKMLFGEIAVVLISGRKALPKKLEDAGFKFKYEKAVDAIKSVLQRNRP
jgi:uncharacterized protein (TIGR01777 family)